MSGPVRSCGWLLGAAALAACSSCLSRPPEGVRHGTEAVAWRTGEVNVVVFVTHDCPVANQSVPELLRLVDEFAPRGVILRVVHVDPDAGWDQIREHARDYGLEDRVEVLHDPAQRLAGALGARATPEAFVLDREGGVRYRGRVDDLYTALGRRRAEQGRRHVAEALRALLAGEAIMVEETEPVGCLLPVPRADG